LLFDHATWRPGGFALPAVMRGAGLRMQAGVLLAAMFFLGGMGGSVVVGRLIDRFGATPVLLVCYGAAAVAVAGYGLAGRAVSGMAVIGSSLRVRAADDAGVRRHDDGRSRAAIVKVHGCLQAFVALDGCTGRGGVCGRGHTGRRASAGGMQR